MPEDDFYTPTDIDALRMENELLTMEKRFLRAKLVTVVTEEVEHLRDRLQEYERRLEDAERRLGESERSAAQLGARLVEAEGAEQDLVLLLRRLANSPFGWYFGTKQNFRALERRYLGDDD